MFTASPSTPTLWEGVPAFGGMRIPVSVIVGQVAHGGTHDEILDDYSDLERVDVRQAIEYAAWLTQEQVQSF